MRIGGEEFTFCMMGPGYGPVFADSFEEMRKKLRANNSVPVYDCEVSPLEDGGWKVTATNTEAEFNVSAVFDNLQDYENAVRRAIGDSATVRGHRFPTSFANECGPIYSDSVKGLGGNIMVFKDKNSDKHDEKVVAFINHAWNADGYSVDIHTSGGILKDEWAFVSIRDYAGWTKSSKWNIVKHVFPHGAHFRFNAQKDLADKIDGEIEFRPDDLHEQQPEPTYDPAMFSDGTERPYDDSTGKLVFDGQDGDYEEVDHPKHYNDHPSGVECIDIIECMPFNVGSAIKYLWRAGMKPGQGYEKDMKKALWYIQREIKRCKDDGA